MVGDIVGISCNFDVIVPAANLPEVRAGEALAFIDTGAYQDANATNFNALPRPATVLVTGDRSEIVKRAEPLMMCSRVTSSSAAGRSAPRGARVSFSSCRHHCVGC